MLFAAAAALRVALVWLSFAVPAYTDVDYHVATEASESVFLGQSPYSLRTPLLRAHLTRFRYTPLLAYALLPNVWLHPAWGKAVFCALDLLAGAFLRSWLLHFSPQHPATVSMGLRLWLFNPFCFVVSSRGSGESIVVVAVYAALLLLFTPRPLLSWAGAHAPAPGALAAAPPLRPSSRWAPAALLYGFSVHWRLYPVIYALPLAQALALTGGTPRKDFARFVNWPAIRFGAVSALVPLGLSLLFYRLYGWDFLHEAYLYHLGRLDSEHNFSVYFYPISVQSACLQSGWAGGLGGASAKCLVASGVSRLAFVPQLSAVVYFGLAHSSNPAVSLLLQTLAFVATNKVATAQYFVWWWALVPLALPWLAWRRRALWRAAAAWSAAALHWTLWADLVGCRGLIVWLASCLVLAANCLLTLELVRSVRRAEGAWDEHPAAAPKLE